MAYRFNAGRRMSALSFLGRVFQALIMGLGPRWTAVGVILIGLAWLYATYGPQAPKISSVRRHMAESLIREAVRQFPWNREVGTVFMLPVQGDWGSFITDALRREIEESGRFQLAPEPVVRRILNDLHIYPESSLDEERVGRVLRSMKEDTLLLARLRSYEEDHRSAVAELNCVFIHKATGRVTPVSVFKELRKGLWGWEHLLVRLRLATFGQRLFFWFIAVLVFPLLTMPLTLAVTRRQNAIANLILVSAYSALLIVWSVITIGPIEKWWQGLMMIGVSIAVIAYLLFSCNAIAASNSGGPRVGGGRP